LIEALEHLLHPAVALRTLERVTMRVQIRQPGAAARDVCQGRIS
jgi:hypothetical protein